MSSHNTGNPAVIGLAGFGMTTLILQLHALGLMGIGPVIWLGLVFGGMVQLIAGLQEMKTGNNFGFCAFTGYGSFWICLVLILIGNRLDFFPASETDIGWFLVGWTAFTAILWVGSLRISTALGIVFTLLLAGFVLLDLAHFGHPEFKSTAAYVLIACAFSAWYVMAHIVFADVFGHDVLPVGQPLWQPGQPDSFNEVASADLRLNTGS